MGEYNFLGGFETMFSCPNCKVPIQPGLAFCPNCNQPLTQQMGMGPPQQQQPQQPYQQQLYPQQQGYPPRQFPEHTKQQKPKSSNKIMASILVIIIIVIAAFAGLLLMKPDDENNGDDGGNTANQKPVASISVDKTSINAGETINFDSRDSDDPDGKIVKYLWDFGDGTTTPEKNPSYEFLVSGSYTIELTITDDDGASDVDRITISVKEFIPNKPPIASIYADKTRINEGETINFESGGSDDPDGKIINYEWDFGDGSTSINANPSHEFQNSGSYTVKLTVFDDDDDTGIDTISILVVEPVVEPDPIIIEGSGDDVTSTFKLIEGITIFHMTHDGDSNIIIWLYESYGDDSNLLVNDIGKYDGSALNGVSDSNAAITSPGNHYLKITADGDWKIIIEQPRPTSAPELPRTYSGAGDDVPSPFMLENVKFELSHDGDSNFIVQLFNDDGEYVKLLVNEIGEYDGSVSIKVSDGGYPADTSKGIHYLDITADGNWEVKMTTF